MKIIVLYLGTCSVTPYQFSRCVEAINLLINQSNNQRTTFKQFYAYLLCNHKLHVSALLDRHNAKYQK